MCTAATALNMATQEVANSLADKDSIDSFRRMRSARSRTGEFDRYFINEWDKETREWFLETMNYAKSKT